MNVIFSIFLLIQPRLPFMIVVHNNHRANGLAGDDWGRQVPTKTSHSLTSSMRLRWRERTNDLMGERERRWERKNIKAKRERRATRCAAGEEKLARMISHVPVFISSPGKMLLQLFVTEFVLKRKKRGCFYFFPFLIVVVVTGDVCDAAERKLASANDQL